MLDVLLLLAVSGRLLEGLDDEGGGRGDDGDGGLAVLDGELDGDAEALPVARRFGDVFTDPGGCALVGVVKGGWGRIRTSWARDREDRSWGRELRRHRLHHRWHGGG